MDSLLLFSIVTNHVLVVSIKLLVVNIVLFFKNDVSESL